ncbi:hypothetical protein HF998_02000 [Cellulomonas hominis]|nr:hypothetical protein [Cellulomonas hominis]
MRGYAGRYWSFGNRWYVELTAVEDSGCAGWKVVAWPTLLSADGSRYVDRRAVSMRRHRARLLADAKSWAQGLEDGNRTTGSCDERPPEHVRHAGATTRSGRRRAR